MYKKFGRVQDCLDQKPKSKWIRTKSVIGIHPIIKFAQAKVSKMTVFYLGTSSMSVINSYVFHSFPMSFVC